MVRYVSIVVEGETHSHVVIPLGEQEEYSTYFKKKLRLLISINYISLCFVGQANESHHLKEHVVKIVIRPSLEQ